jgi:hypothetical protein
MDRHADLRRLYAALDALEGCIDGKHTLAECHGRMVWPPLGVYFFFEASELRSETGTGPRVVRVGTHGLKAGSGTSLWRRLSQHRGITSTGGGNHRGSIFRLCLLVISFFGGLPSGEPGGLTTLTLQYGLITIFR